MRPTRQALVENDPSGTTLHRNFILNGQIVSSREGPASGAAVGAFAGYLEGLGRASYDLFKSSSAQFKDLDNQLAVCRSIGEQPW